MSSSLVQTTVIMVECAIVESGFEANRRVVQDIFGGLSLDALNVCDINSCKAKSVKSFRLRREGAYTPPAPTLYAQQPGHA